MMERYICIHGHFYQPPRENPWLEAIERQESAQPYHDWNKRITAECYATNATSRILDADDQIVQIVNNYAKISFNFGPTLLSWIEDYSPLVYEAIIEADRQSRKTFFGHGSALAQVYNHTILPLANRRDKYTQVIWGIRDFEKRFGRFPEGLWLPETAVDLESLDILAELGIRFTILAPSQAKRVRPPGAGEWMDVGGGRIDPRRAYTLSLPSGRTLALFFYDGGIAKAVAFEKLLSSGEAFARKLANAFSEGGDPAQIVHIATDGESYGHHHRFGDMALAYALHLIESRGPASLINYGAYLEKHPPAHEVEIFENTAWSCFHGVGRWQTDCGCNTGAQPTWNQSWRGPLREALDWLRDTINPLFEKESGSLFKEPWRARDRYIDVILDRSSNAVDAFLDRELIREPDEKSQVTALKFMELQRHAMLMYTSCGWFFDDLSGIETIQILQYAGRVIQLAGQLFGRDFESGFLKLLARAKSNLPERGDGRRIYEISVKPAVSDLDVIGAHYAMCSLFREEAERTDFYCYGAGQEDLTLYEAGKAKLLTGKVEIFSKITRERAFFCFCTLHLGDHNLTCGIRTYDGEADYQRIKRDIAGIFRKADFPETIRRFDKHFGTALFSLKSLFKDEQAWMLKTILQSTLTKAEAVYRQLYEDHVPLLRFLLDSDIPPPKALTTAAAFWMNSTLREAFEEDPIDPEKIETLLDASRAIRIELDSTRLEFSLRYGVEKIARQFKRHPNDLSILNQLERILILIDRLPFVVNLWTVQNICYDILKTVYPKQPDDAERLGGKQQQWTEGFRRLCRMLSVKVD